MEERSIPIELSHKEFPPAVDKDRLKKKVKLCSSSADVAADMDTEENPQGDDGSIPEHPPRLRLLLRTS